MNTWQRFPLNEPDKMWRGDYLPVILAPLPDEKHWYDVVMALYDPGSHFGEWFADDVPDAGGDITARVVAFIEPPREAEEWAKKRKEELG